MDPTNIFSNYDLSSYMFNSNTPIPFNYDWFTQDSSYKRGGTAPISATRNNMRNMRPGFDNTIYKFNSRNSLNSKESDTNVIKLNDIKKISKIYNSTNIKPDKYARKKLPYHTTYNPTPTTQFSAKSNPYSSRNSLNHPKNTCKNHEFPSRQGISSSQSLRKIKSSIENNTGNLWISEGLKKRESYFLKNTAGVNLNKQMSENNSKKQPILAKEPLIYSYEVDLQQKKPCIESLNQDKPEVPIKNFEENNNRISSNEENKEKRCSDQINTQENLLVFNDTIVHTDASSEPDKEDEEEREEAKTPPRMFLTAQHFRQDKAENNNQEPIERQKESSEESLQFFENNDMLIETPTMEIEEKTLIQSKLLGMSRPKTSEGGRRRRVITHNDQEILMTKPPTILLETQEKSQKKEDSDEEELVLEKKAINLEYIQSLQNQRPPCRKKVQAFNLDHNFERTTIPKFEKTTAPLVDRPPSRHKTPPKAIGLDIPHPDNKVFPIKSMYVKYAEESNPVREDSFTGLDLVKLENKVNLSNFEEKKQKNWGNQNQGKIVYKEEQKSELTFENKVNLSNFEEKFQNNMGNIGKIVFKDEQKSEILDEISKKENAMNERNSHPFSASGFTNKGRKKFTGLSKNNNILNEKALKNNFMNSKIPRNEPVEIVINHNKSAAPKLSANSNVQVPFETSLGSDFLSLFANANLQGNTPRKKAL